MGITRTIGGDRIGSGGKMKAHLHNWFRSTHNLSEKFASSMTSGVLYPVFCKLAMRGDSFNIEMAADARTIPTKGPLFGSFKVDIHFYQCPVRLYQGILHNNPLAIGLKMNQIYFPEIRITDRSTRENCGEMSKSCLLKYLGLSGLGKPISTDVYTEEYSRRINAIPLLAYYDIAKNYYFNKQEENAYVISQKVDRIENFVTNVNYNNSNISPDTDITLEDTEKIITLTLNTTKDEDLLNVHNILFQLNPNDQNQLYTLKELRELGYVEKYAVSGNIQTLKITLADKIFDDFEEFVVVSVIKTNEGLQLIDFPIENIDDMRYDLLTNNRLGDQFIIAKSGLDAKGNYLPYSVLCGNDMYGDTLNKYPLNGLVLKTYQSDIYNNWLNAEWIEGENGINELSSVSIDENGAFSMDALNFAQKLYNMLNRVAIAGNTYEDWQDVMYEEVKRKQIESPMFVGGMSQEIMFDEVIQTTPTEDSALGSLGGRGKLVGNTRKGGKLHIKCDEACFIIGIASITPRIFYTQGNEFYLTDIKTMDDIHKPAMDGIGFQDLVGERLAWWDATITPTGVGRSKIGKLPSWIEYMTSVDRAYGDFAEEYGKGYMILNRNYERDEETGGIKDATTYIDPTKYNYAFAYTALDAQNFWMEIGFKVTARRLMSARLIPNI